MGAAALVRGSTNNALDPQGAAPVPLVRGQSGQGRAMPCWLVSFDIMSLIRVDPLNSLN